MRQLSLIAFFTLAIAGCGSEDPAGTGGAGGAGAGGAGGAGGGPAEDVCAAAASPDVTDVSGRWAYLEVGAQLVQAPGFANPFRNKIVSLLLLDMTQVGEDITVTGEYCDHFTEDPDAVVHAVIPEAYRDAIPPIARAGTLSAGLFKMPRLYEVFGADLMDVENEALPTDAADPRLVDLDADGNPGLTIRLTGLIDGEVYVAQRKWTEIDGVAVSNDRIQGPIGFSSEQSTVASNPPDLKDTITGTTTFPDTEACSSYFKMVRVAADTDCVSLRAQEDTLFQ